jgi:hypothetical protein
MTFPSIRRTVVLTLTAASLAGTSACFGSFNLTRKLYGFNKDVSPNKFVREVVFLAFNVVPVYGAAGFVDAVITNSIEFWTGKNPVQMTSRVRLDDGTTVVRVVSEKNGARIMTIKAFRLDKLVSTTTMEMVGNDGIAYETVLADGRRISDVVRMGTDGGAVATGVQFHP